MTPWSFKRSERVGSTLARDVALILQMHVRDPRLELVTITEARISDDLRSARIYFVVNGANPKDEENIWKNAERGLKSASGFIRRELGKAMDLRRVPELIFVRDQSLDHGSRMERILGDISGDEVK